MKKKFCTAQSANNYAINIYVQQVVTQMCARYMHVACMYTTTGIVVSNLQTCCTLS